MPTRDRPLIASVELPSANPDAAAAAVPLIDSASSQADTVATNSTRRLASVVRTERTARVEIEYGARGGFHCFASRRS